jgi:hypothetical protein
LGKRYGEQHTDENSSWQYEGGGTDGGDRDCQNDGQSHSLDMAASVVADEEPGIVSVRASSLEQIVGLCKAGSRSSQDPTQTNNKFRGHIGQAFYNLGFWIIKRLSSQTKAGKPVTG